MSTSAPNLSCLDRLILAKDGQHARVSDVDIRVTIRARGRPDNLVVSCYLPVPRQTVSGHFARSLIDDRPIADTRARLGPGAS